MPITFLLIIIIVVVLHGIAPNVRSIWQLHYRPYQLGIVLYAALFETSQPCNFGTPIYYYNNTISNSTQLNRQFKIGWGDRHRPTTPRLTSCRLRECCTCTWGAPACLSLARRHPATLLDDERRHQCHILPQTLDQRPHPRMLVPDELLECRVSGLTHIVRPVRPQWRWRHGRSTRLGRPEAVVVVIGPMVGARWRLEAARRGVVQWRTSRRSSRSRRRDAGGCWREDVPSRPVRPPVATVPGRPASRQVFGDVVRVIQGGQSEFLHTSPRTLAQVNKTPLYVDLLVKHGRHSLRGPLPWDVANTFQWMWMWCFSCT